MTDSTFSEQKEDTPLNPFEWFRKDALTIKERLDNCEDRNGCRESIMVLGEILRCYTKLLTGIYVSIYLREDYPYEKNDKYVFEFFLHKYLSHNEMIGLCDLLKLFLQHRTPVAKSLPCLFHDGFNNVRLLSPPIIVKDNDINKLKKYGEHVYHVIETFHEQKQISGIEENFVVRWNSDEFPENQEHLDLFDGMRYYRRQAKICTRAVRFAGDCFLLSRENPDFRLELSPTVIALRDEELQESIAVISNYRGDSGDIIGRFENRGLLKYRELTGQGKTVYTCDERLFTNIYYKIGTLLEEPEFKKHFYLMENRDFKIDLFSGDIFDLNFLKKDVNRKGLVNVTYTSPHFHTPLSMRLELLSGKKLEDTLPGRSDRGEVHMSEGGKLDFDVIFHCPVYDVNIKQRKDPTLKYINSTISNLLDLCAKNNIDVLVVPSIGSYWGDQERYKVAKAWCRNIRSIGIDHPLRRIIFAFINEQALDVYNHTIEYETSVRISHFHWPVKEIVKEIEKSLVNNDFHARFGNCLKLCEYIHYFLVAWALKAMMMERDQTQDNGNLKAAGELLKIFRERHKYNTGRNFDSQGIQRKKSSYKKPDPLGMGGWRKLCYLADRAIKDSSWGYAAFFHHEKEKLRKFNKILGGGQGSDELINLRNRFQGHNLSLKAQESHSVTFKKIADTAYELICSYLDAMPFLQNFLLALVLVEKFEIIDLDRDECAVWFHEIHRDIIKPEKKYLKLSSLDGIFFEEGKIYLMNRQYDPEERKGKAPLALNMHPFLVQGTCTACASDTLFIWNNFHQDDDGYFTLDYGCIACGALKTDFTKDDGFIGRFDRTELDSKFNELMDALFKRYCE